MNKKNRISELKIPVSPALGEVSCIAIQPEESIAAVLLAHGAGAGMRHPFMSKLAESLADLKISVLRYQFPYMEQGKKMPDKPAAAYQTIRAVVNEAGQLYQDLPLFLSGKSFGGRMSSQAVANKVVDRVEGIVFFGFPLHAPGKPSTERADHLSRVVIPMLFLQGSADKLADIVLIRETVSNLSKKAEVHIIDQADHSFRTPKSLQVSYDQTINELAALTRNWTLKVIGANAGK